MNIQYAIIKWQVKDVVEGIIEKMYKLDQKAYDMAQSLKEYLDELEEIIYEDENDNYLEVEVEKYEKL